MTRDNLRLAGAAAIAVALVAGVGLLIWRGGGDAAPPGAGGSSAAPAGPADAARVVYDPTKLVENGVPAGEVFLKEPRDEVWAGAAETAIGGKMRGDLERLVPGATLQMQCKTLTCLIGVDAPEDKRPLALAVVKVIMLGPLLVDLDPEEDGTQRFLFITEPRMSDPQVFTEWYQRTRKRTFAEIKAGSRPNPIPLPSDQLPDD
jgi:hypothetical protein